MSTTASPLPSQLSQRPPGTLNENQPGVSRHYPQYGDGWHRGQCYDMSGEEAQVFVRMRYDVPGGDFGRMRSQQLVMRALAEKAASFGVLSNPVVRGADAPPPPLR